MLINGLKRIDLLLEKESEISAQVNKKSMAGKNATIHNEIHNTLQSAHVPTYDRITIFASLYQFICISNGEDMQHLVGHYLLVLNGVQYVAFVFILSQNITRLILNFLI